MIASAGITHRREAESCDADEPCDADVQLHAINAPADRLPCTCCAYQQPDGADV